MPVAIDNKHGILKRTFRWLVTVNFYLLTSLNIICFSRYLVKEEFRQFIFFLITEDKDCYKIGIQHFLTHISSGTDTVLKTIDGS